MSRQRTALLGLSHPYRARLRDLGGQLAQRGGSVLPSTASGVVDRYLEAYADQHDTTVGQAVEAAELTGALDELLALSEKGTQRCSEVFLAERPDCDDDRVFARLEGFGGKAIRMLLDAAECAYARGDVARGRRLTSVAREMTYGMNAGRDFDTPFECLQSTFIEARDLLAEAAGLVECGHWTSCRCTERPHDGHPFTDPSLLDELHEAVDALGLLQPSHISSQTAS